MTTRSWTAVAVALLGATLAQAATNAAGVATNKAARAGATNAPPDVTPAVTPAAPPAGQPGIVERIDATTHTIVAKGADGRSVVAAVGANDARLKTLKPGAAVALRVETVALDMQKAVVVSGPRAVARPTTISRPRNLLQPGDTAMTTVQGSLKAIDTAARTLTIAGGDGMADMTMRIGDSVRDASRFQPGDRVMVHFTQRCTLAP